MDASQTKVLDQIKFQTIASRQYLIAWSSLLIWDWMITLPVEVEHIWLKKKTPLRITFLLNRYGTLFLNSWAVALIVSHVPENVCAKLFWIERLTLVWVLLLSALVSAQLAILVAAAAYVQPLKSPPTFILDYLDSYGCLVADPDGDQAALGLMFFCAPFATTAVLLFATIFRRWQLQKKQKGVQLPILQKMIRDGALYLVCITVVTILNAYFFIQSIEAFKSLNICAVVVVSSTLSCRLVLSILAHKPDSTSGIIISQVSISRVTISRPPSPTPHEPPSSLPSIIEISPFVDHFASEPRTCEPKPAVKKKKGVTFA